jgi:hypothetical protein
MPKIRKTTTAIAGAAAVAALVLALSASGAAVPSAIRPASHLHNPTKSATTLVHRFFVLIQQKDVAGLQQFLSPAFQVERADGSGAGKKEYLAKLATIHTFEIKDLHATQAGGALVVRYLATVEGTVNGKPYTPGPAPRLSVFTWNGKRWQLAAHANFNPLTG